ncbi:MAG: ribosome-associated translation inhibitor RaiA [Phycisphaerae bacterium]|jgi:putative sigma-54 modulation protein
MDIKVTGRHFDVTPGVKTHLEEKAEKLTRFYSLIEGVEVVIDGAEGGKVLVELIVKVDHNQPVIVKEKEGDHENLYQIVDAAFEKAERQIKKIKEKERNPMHAG